MTINIINNGINIFVQITFVLIELLLIANFIKRLGCNIDQDVNEEVINVELAKLSEWLGANRLALNISKTKYMVFHTSNRAVKYPNLKINNTYIEHVYEFNFLGVIFNSHMNWNTHINYIASKISRTVGILYRLKDIYIYSICPTYTIQHIDFTTFPLLFIIMVIIDKRKSPTPHASKESSENN